MSEVVSLYELRLYKENTMPEKLHSIRKKVHTNFMSFLEKQKWLKVTELFFEPGKMVEIQQRHCWT